MLGCLCELFVTEAAYKLAQSIVHEPEKWEWDAFRTWNGGPRPRGQFEYPGVVVWHANEAYGLHIDHNGQRWCPNWWDRQYIYSAIQHAKAQRGYIVQRTIMDAVFKATA